MSNDKVSPQGSTLDSFLEEEGIKEAVDHKVKELMQVEMLLDIREHAIAILKNYVK